MNFSGLPRRFWAYFFDLIILSGIYYGLLLLLRMAGIDLLRVKDLVKNDYSFLLNLYISFGIFFVIYEVIFLSSNLSATPGKLIMEMEVVCTNANLYKVLIRSLVKAISSLTGLYIILFTIAAFNDKKQATHDLLSGSFVIDAENSKYSQDVSKSEEIYLEMKNRGLRTFSEQKALTEEMYGKSNKSTNTLSNPLVWILVLVISIAINLLYTKIIYSEVKSYLENMPQTKGRSIYK
ncbi:MAG: RDD family protein [Firmicutes bacterium ADurb.Bin419]|nr:MAG: RDD family protein [Firmicutes bacterium ADurb.Bin419]